MKFNNWPWHIENLPFYYAPLLTGTNGEIPDFLPFTLDIEKDTGLLVQRSNQAVSNALDMAYQKGSIISGIMDDSGIGKKYASDFLKFIKTKLNGQIKGKKILEIGCGTGYLLHELHQLGANVVGIEPGEHGQVGAEKYNVNIIRDFFPSQKITERFDVVIMYCVLEHISDPNAFLQLISDYLLDNGKVILAVPDCKPYIDCGDISMLFHEHFSYFSEITLKNLLLNSMKQATEVQRASFGGLLYAVTERTSLKPSMDKDCSGERYNVLADHYIKRLKKYFSEYSSEEIGIYVAGRAINVLTLLKSEIDVSTLRFFDDNIMLHNTYFPGFINKIESRKELLDNPPDRILVMSFTFGDEIKQSLKCTLSENVSVDTIYEIDMIFD